jgi:hypothetical protein
MMRIIDRRRECMAVKVRDTFSRMKRPIKKPWRASKKIKQVLI